MKTTLRHDIRNVAIIAHVDHGKTTLVDALLKQSHTFREGKEVGELIMDTGSQEKERGITILAKNTSIEYKGVTINIIDTPGHADFGGEVERVLNMADGCLLLIDAAEGPMPQTRTVLRHAFEAGLKPILVINKLDRKDAEPKRALELAENLFLELAHDDSQLDIPTLYAIARDGKSGANPTNLSLSLEPLFQAILEHIPCPIVEEGSFQMLIANKAYDNYTGQQAIGRISRGTIAQGQSISLLQEDGTAIPSKVGTLLKFQGLGKVQVERASAGDIVILTGPEKITIGDTISDPNDKQALPRINITEPTVQMTFGVNSSPLSGKEGKFSTSRQLRGRLYEELESNLGLRVKDTDQADTFLVSGRGELHLAVLIETMRREGYEFEVSRPSVIFKEENNHKTEPIEHVFIEVPQDYLGGVSSALGKRRGEMIEMNSYKDLIHLDYKMPTRALIGFRNTFLTITAGTGVIGSILIGYEPYMGEFSETRNGALTASQKGIVTNFAIGSAQERGDIFVSAGEEVYEGMVVGLQKRPGDIAVNVCRMKEQTNIRSSTADIATKITPTINLSLEQKLDFLANDELLEITPKSLRLRKKYLSASDQVKARKGRLPL